VRPLNQHPAVLGVAAAVAVAVLAGAAAQWARPSNPSGLVVSGGVPLHAPAAVAPTAQIGQAPATITAPGTPPAYTAWAGAVAGQTGVPARALQAYAAGDATLRVEQPGCGLTWVTLAGIGRTESDHGRYRGRTLRGDGTPSTPIVGIALDGGPSVAAIADTDRGALDADTRWDRAVGPMQFIPSSWARWGADANGDGVADPQNIDDAALAAGRYLCASGRDLTVGAAWWTAVLSYNASTTYAGDVLAAAQGYALAASS